MKKHKYGFGRKCDMLKDIGAVMALYPTPVTVVGRCWNYGRDFQIPEKESI